MNKKLLAWSAVVLVPLFVFLLKGGGSEASSEDVRKKESVFSGGDNSEAADEVVQSERSEQARLKAIKVQNEGPPADAGPSVAEQIAFAKDSPFNFVCVCCGDHQKYLDVLEREGLTWPSIWEGLEDEVAFLNLKMREEQAILLSLEEPHRAVDFFEAQIELEREKLAMRDAREGWDESRNGEDGPGDVGALGEMMSEITDKYFERVTLEVLEYHQPGIDHLEAIAKQAKARPDEIRMKAYGALADQELIHQIPEGGEILRELDAFLGEKFGSSYHTAVNDHFEGIINEEMRVARQAAQEAGLEPGS